ncbi:hypothetical protein [Prescottella subtropica]|uniref:hypothetical protein n=1 Tax=Prescottella subtropica TaxID=2545757 RepID=UPI0010F5397C|nr:hypothetical protein [Prescottella subtropica]
MTRNKAAKRAARERAHTVGKYTEDMATGARFGESQHPPRLRAEQFATEILVRLGESVEWAVHAAATAGRAATAGGGWHAVRIYGRRLDGTVVGSGSGVGTHPEPGRL